MKTQALGAAASVGDVELVKRLLVYGGNPGGEVRDSNEYRAVLMEAVRSGVPEVVERILSGRPNMNARDEKGRNALWYLIDASPYFDEVRHADRGEVVHLLAKAGANLNAQDEEGNTALHEAYEVAIAGALIEEGANVNVRNARGESPLMRNFSADVAKLLVAAGADIHARDHAGMAALDHTLELEKDGDRVKYLRSLKISRDREEV